jgi:tyrosinase
MTFLDYSAFDPIFWLHHTNVDRLFAMWQAINPGSQMTPALEPGTYSIPHNNLDTTMTPLYPFTSTAAGQLYTSLSSLNCSNFNYAYPEIEDWHQTPDQLKNNVTAQINQMYDPNGLWDNNARLLKARNALKAGAVTREWSVAVKIAKFDLDGEMFRIRIFLGDIPADPREWALISTHIGTMLIMPPPYDGPKPFPNITVFDEWSLTRTVIAAGHDPSNADEVTSYLKKNLNWRAQKVSLLVTFHYSRLITS